MTHPPQEWSNRSLAYSTLLGVLWQMCHAWITYGMVRKDCPENKQIMWSKKELTRSIPHYMLLEALWQPCHAWITHRSICRVVLATKAMLHMELSLMCNQGAHDKQTHVTNVQVTKTQATNK